MHTHFKIFGREIPAYGTMIVIGVIVANIVAYIYLKKKRGMEEYNEYDFMLTEIYALIGGFVGAKLLYIFTVRNLIDWGRLAHDGEYFMSLISGGFVFYGGLIGALIFAFLARAIHKINVIKYVRQFIFAVPLAHGFGRIGCFMAGCCYGVPYHGPLSVVFPKGSLAPPGIELFPVQLVEAICLFGLFAIMLLSKIKFNFKYQVELYVVLYGIVRFIIEFFRFDEARGRFLIFSTSQWICFGMFAYAIISVLIKRKIEKSRLKV